MTVDLRKLNTDSNLSELKRLVTQEHINAYAEASGDFNPLHIDPEFAKNTKVGGLFASGAHLLAICCKLGFEREFTGAWTAGLGWEKIQFLAPARPGDILVMEKENIWKRASESDPSVGIVHSATKLLNQRGEVVFAMEGTGLIEKRPAKRTPYSQSSLL